MQNLALANRRYGSKREAAPFRLMSASAGSGHEPEKRRSVVRGHDYRLLRILLGSSGPSRHHSSFVGLEGWANLGDVVR